MYKRVVTRYDYDGAENSDAYWQYFCKGECGNMYLVSQDGVIVP